MRAHRSVRWFVAAFRAFSALFPARFRDDWLGEAVSDLESALATAHARGGAGGVVRAGAAALWDAVLRLPGEWARELARLRHAGAGGSAWTDVRQAARALLRRPGYAVTAVLTLGLGLGANAAIFTVVRSVLLRPLPFADSDRIVGLHHTAPAIGLDELDNSPGTVRFYREEADFLVHVTSYDVFSRNLVGTGRPERVRVLSATASLFPLLGVQPLLGQAFDDSDASEGAAPVAVLTYPAWESRFGLDPEVLGRSLTLDGVPTTVVGVMPEGFALPDPRIAAITPAGVDPAGRFGSFGISAVARLAPGLDLAAARARLNEVQTRLPGYFPELSADFLGGVGWAARMERLPDRVVGTDTTRGLWLVFGAVALVLLIACANVANLFLVRAEGRHRELAIRSAVGAGRIGVARSFVAEAALLAGAGGVLVLVGLALGLAGGAALGRVIGALLYGVTAADPLTFAGAPLLLTLVALAATWLPSRHATRVDPVRVLGAE